MKTRHALLLAVLLGPGLAMAAEFVIPKLSAAYAARIVVAHCDDTQCSGPATIELIDAKTHATVQRFESQDMSILLDKKHRPAVNATQLYSDQSALIVDDFNFDGQDDLAIRNGNNSSYGGPSYDVYVYNRTRKAFVPSADLTELATSTLGMFQVDHQRKRLETLEKSGCCWHLTTQYAVVPKVGLQKVYTREEAMATDGEHLDITEGRLVNGRWKTSTHREAVKQDDKH